MQFSYSGREGEEHTVVGRQSGREVRRVVSSSWPSPAPPLHLSCTSLHFEPPL